MYAYVYWMRGSAHTHVSSFAYVRRIHNMLGPCLLFEFGWLDVGNVLRCNFFALLAVQCVSLRSWIGFYPEQFTRRFRASFRINFRLGHDSKKTLPDF